MNNFITDMINEINKLPSILKYPLLLQMCQELLQELGKAEEEYIKEQRRLTLGIMEIAKERKLDFLGEEDEKER